MKDAAGVPARVRPSIHSWVLHSHATSMFTGVDRGWRWYEYSVRVLGTGEVEGSVLTCAHETSSTVARIL